MVEIRCITVDDEPPALKLMTDYISKVSFLTLVKACRSGMEALEIIGNSDIDLVFLDIEMPDLTGIELLNTLQDRRAQIIFTTAYSEYALEGYDLNVMDYLLKPFTFERFIKAVNKAYEFIILKKQAQQLDITKDHFFVKSDYQQVKIRIGEILYIEGVKDYVKIHLTDKTVLTLSTLKAMEGQLAGRNFLRIHKSYIISFNKIESYTKSHVKIGQKLIPVGESYREPLEKKLSDNN